MHFGKFRWKFGLQKVVAAAPHRFVGDETVKTLGPCVPELDRTVQSPRQHGFIGQCQQAGQALSKFGACLDPGGCTLNRHRLRTQAWSRRSISLFRLPFELHPEIWSYRSADFNLWRTSAAPRKRT